MPAYDFRCGVCGATTEQRHLMSEAPRTIQCGCGGLAKRLIGTGATVNTQPCSSKYPYVSQRLPKNAKGCQTDSAGCPVIMNRQHEDRVLQTLGYDRE